MRMLMPKILVQLIWVTMDPGDVPWDEINIVNDTTAYPKSNCTATDCTKDSLFGVERHADFARAFVIIFELLCAIILINLLIAAMNNTGLI